MEVYTIYELLKSNMLDCTTALETLSSSGYCPCLFNDDNGHWAVSFDGYQEVPVGKKAQDVMTSSIIREKFWKKSIREALIYALKEGEDETED